MSKFEVGDRVRRKTINNACFSIGDTGTIIGFNIDGFAKVARDKDGQISLNHFKYLELIHSLKEKPMRYYGTVYHVNGTLFVGPYSSMEEVMKWLNLESRPLVVQSRSITIKDV